VNRLGRVSTFNKAVDDFERLIEIKWNYLANSPLIGQIEFAQNGALRMITSRNYDNLNRLQSIETVNSQPVLLASSVYGYNMANQRVAVTNADQSRWSFGYDPLGQVTSSNTPLKKAPRSKLACCVLQLWRRAEDRPALPLDRLRGAGIGARTFLSACVVQSCEGGPTRMSAFL
jgi:YD repeat-containing protein